MYKNQIDILRHNVNVTYWRAQIVLCDDLNSLVSKVHFRLTANLLILLMIALLSNSLFVNVSKIHAYLIYCTKLNKIIVMTSYYFLLRK